MAKRIIDEPMASRREQERAAMLQEALACPGVRDVMKVYGDWLEKDRRLDAYRTMTKISVNTTTTDHTRAR